MVSAIRNESYTSKNKKMKEVEAKYAIDNCKLMPDPEKWKVESEMLAEQHKIDEEKIYKIYHPD